MSGPECLICAIVRGDEESSPVYRDGTVIAFLDLMPVTPGHLMVAPRRHIAGLAELPEDVGAHLWRVGHRMAGALRRSGLRCEGVNLFLADGAAAFQEVFHVHLHVFPRYRGDGFAINADWRARDRAELDATATVIRAALDQ